jgi:heme/copper-type cytochrome/quinol oxidase subunit 2
LNLAPPGRDIRASLREDAHPMPHPSVLLRTCVGAFALANAAPSAANSFAITPNTSSGMISTYKWSVSVDGGFPTNNPTLVVLTGQDYAFHLTNVTFHPFWIDDLPGIGSQANSFPKSGGISDNGVTSDTTIKMNLPADAPDTLYYACGNHISMNGMITVVHDLVFRASFD